MLSEGQSDKAAGARKTVINAAVGLVIIIVATRVISFIANTLTESSSSTTVTQQIASARGDGKVR